MAENKVSSTVKVPTMKAKKKVDYRDTMYKYLAEFIAETEGLAKVVKVKEGLVIDVKDDQYIVRVIKKKEKTPITREDEVMYEYTPDRYIFEEEATI